MKPQEVDQLIGDAKELSKLFHEGFCSLLEREITDLSKEEIIDLLKSRISAQSDKLRFDLFHSFTEDSEIKKFLLIDASDSTRDVLFDSWYNAFVFIEKNTFFVSQVMQHRSELIDDGLFINGRNSYIYNDDQFILAESSFYWSVHLIVLVFYFYARHNITYLQKEIAKLSNTGKGLNCLLSTEVKKKIYDGLVDKEIIDATEKNFIAAMTYEPLPPNFEKVKWILTGKSNKPHKTALREFLKLHCSPAQGRKINVPHQADIDRTICDAAGNPIPLAKPTKKKPSNYLSFFEDLVK